MQRANLILNYSNKVLQPQEGFFYSSKEGEDGFQVVGLKLHTTGYLQPHNDVNFTQEGGSSVSSTQLIPSFSLLKQQIQEHARLRVFSH